MSKSFSICPECNDECLDDCFDSELGICPACIREMKRKADAHEKLVKTLKLYHFDSKEHGGQTDYQSPATKVLRELGEL